MKNNKFDFNISFNRTINKPINNINSINNTTNKDNCSLDFSELIDEDYCEKKSINYDNANNLTDKKTQGYTETDNFVYITSHYKGNNSRIYVYDKETGEALGYIELNNRSHVGGITYDKENNIIYVTGSGGNILAYDNNIIENYINSFKDYEIDGKKIKRTGKDVKLVSFSDEDIENNVMISSEISLGIGSKNAATTYYYEDTLYVASFRQESYGDFRAFKPEIIVENGIRKVIPGEPLFTTVVPPSTQGIAITEWNGKKYLISTQSMGPFSKGIISVAELKDDGTTEIIGFRYAKPGIQGIQVDEFGNVSYVSEYGEEQTEILTMDYLLSGSDKIDQNEVVSFYLWSKSYGFITGDGFKGKINDTVHNDVSGVTDYMNYLQSKFGVSQEYNVMTHLTQGSTLKSTYTLLKQLIEMGHEKTNSEILNGLLSIADFGLTGAKILYKGYKTLTPAPIQHGITNGLEVAGVGINGIINVGSGIITDTKNTVSLVKEGDYLKAGESLLKTAAHIGKNSFKAGLSFGKAAIENAADNATYTLEWAGKKLHSGAKWLISQVDCEEIEDTCKSVWYTVEDAYYDSKEWVSDKWETGCEAVAGVCEAGWDAAVGAYEDVKDWGSDRLEDISNIWDDITGIFG